jgi:hypothetical protein
MSTRGTRVIRGLLVAAVALTVAAVSHISGGGQIEVVGLVLAFAFSSLASIALAGRTVSLARVSIAVVFSQGVFHLLFGIGAGHLASIQGHAAGMVMGDPSAPPFADALEPSRASMTDSGWMWAAHGVAAVLTIVALVKGERTFWTLADWVRHSLAPIVPTSLHEAFEQVAEPETVRDLIARRAQFLLAGMRHRGPPRPAAST